MRQAPRIRRGPAPILLNERDRLPDESV